MTTVTDLSRVTGTRLNLVVHLQQGVAHTLGRFQMAPTKPNRLQAEQSARTGTGSELHQQPEAGGAALTTNHGVVIADNQNSLKANPRGPTLLEDFILREK